MLDIDRIGLEAQLGATDARIAELEGIAAQYRDLLEAAEAAEATYCARTTDLECRIVEIRAGARGRTASAREIAEHDRLEGELARAHEERRAWVNAASIEEHVGLRVRRWSTRDADAVRTRLYAIGDELQYLGVQRDQTADELDRQDEAARQDDSGQPRPLSWHQKLFGGRHAPAIE